MAMRVLSLSISIVICCALAASRVAAWDLLNRINNKYEVVRVDTSDLYFKHPVKPGTILFSENAFHAHGVKAAHPTSATFKFSAYGKSFEVGMEKNMELYAPNYRELGLYYDEHGNYKGREVVHENGMPEHLNCFYNSWTSSDEREPVGVMNTCYGGFSGIVYGHGESLGIEPAGNHLSMKEQTQHAHRLFGAGTDPASVDMHVIYRLSDDVLKVPFHCSVGNEDGHTHDHASHTTQSSDDHDHDHADATTKKQAERNQSMADFYHESRAISRKLLQVTPVRYVELMLVNDHARMVLSRTTPAWDVQVDTADVASRVALLYRTPPSDGATFKYGATGSQVTTTYMPILVGQTSFLNNDPYTITKQQGQTYMETPVTQLLPAFNQWRSNPSNLVVSPATPGCPNHDNGHLLSGFKFDGSTLGYAGVSTMCSFPTSGGVNQALSASSNPGDAAGAHGNPGLHGAIVAHEMGHNFGMQHDSNGNACPQSGFIMNAAASTQSPPTQFSTCSVTYLNTFIASLVAANPGPSGTCLQSTQPLIIFNTTGTCGDGFLSAGEECDCGAPDCQNSASSTDHCCTSGTCRFRTTGLPNGAHATCRESDPCCIPATDTVSPCQPRPASQNYTCRSANGNPCDLEEICTGAASCPLDVYKGAGAPCSTTTDGAGMCYKAQCVSANQICRLQGASITSGAPWQAADADAGCSANPCGDLFCSSVNNAQFQGCIRFSRSSSEFVSVPDGVPCGEHSQCKSTECVPSAELNNEFYYVPSAWGSCSQCDTPQYRTAACTSYGSGQVSVSTEPCSTPSGLPSLVQLCRNDTLGCVYAADVGDDNVSLFGETVAKNTLMFAVLGVSALVLVVLACCYQAVTYGHDEKDEHSPENSQVDGEPEYEDEK